MGCPCRFHCCRGCCRRSYRRRRPCFRYGRIWTTAAARVRRWACVCASKTASRVLCPPRWSATKKSTPLKRECGCVKLLENKLVYQLSADWRHSLWRRANARNVSYCLFHGVPSPSSTLSWYTSLSPAAPTQLPSCLESWHYIPQEQTVSREREI